VAARGQEINTYAGGWHPAIAQKNFKGPPECLVKHRLDRIVDHLDEPGIKDDSSWVTIFELHLW